ncbi:putative protein [Arabidopsis thaliana]|uniref:Protein ADMETOS n=1 Tax=Arabidopsis thaliana TaxID=3702 RepID=ADM_ARATH|nr:uncharacterized protein AT4G11940 [Arabidopsis thaliana]Q9SZ59.1 RecName: Full=Protein ADMETOS [Arabidopsis thaliana]ABE65520.1 hypothetical protein At4g11940 [Arabidopsis thaliana]AEE83072.1 hypothetical protein AT4G11940 [Arabidopsis thaliana]CAB40935.1 putative protein [Arabidopsis thaliana]CAB78237.1 putative protein [Arabidopsis thaliana]|eukprot:NP_192931.1 hypothetical protein AT4G11940 [Arabidopsis thaliana]
MFSGEGASQIRIAPEDKPIQWCYQILKSRDFKSARYITQMNLKLSKTRHDEYEKGLAICDILIAAENRLPNGLLDCYGMIRMTRPGLVLYQNIEKELNLLGWGNISNPFPFRQEASEKFFFAWSLLSNPTIKEMYDYATSDEVNLEPQGNVNEYMDVDSSSQSGYGLGSVLCSDLPGSEYLKEFADVYPLPLAEKGQAPHNRFGWYDHNVGPETNNNVVVTYEDAKEEECDMSSSSELRIINGRRVKITIEEAAETSDTPSCSR